MIYSFISEFLSDGVSTSSDRPHSYQLSDVPHSYQLSDGPHSYQLLNTKRQQHLEPQPPAWYSWITPTILQSPEKNSSQQTRLKSDHLKESCLDLIKCSNTGIKPKLHSDEIHFPQFSVVESATRCDLPPVKSASVALTNVKNHQFDQYSPALRSNEHNYFPPSEYYSSYIHSEQKINTENNCFSYPPEDASPLDCTIAKRTKVDPPREPLVDGTAESKSLPCSIKVRQWSELSPTEGLEAVHSVGVNLSSIEQEENYSTCHLYVPKKIRALNRSIGIA